MGMGIVFVPAKGTVDAVLADVAAWVAVNTFETYVVGVILLVAVSYLIKEWF